MATQHLKLHPLTGNTDHDVTGLSSGQILYVQNPTNGVQSTGIYSDGSGGLTSTTLSTTALSAGTMYSAGTNLYNIFATTGSGVQAVQPGSNITTGGTTTLPTVSLVASPSVNGVTASGTSYFNAASASTLSAFTAHINTLNGYSPITVNDTLKFATVTAISGGTSQATMKINSYSQSDFELSSDQGNYVTGGTFYVGRDGIGAYIDGGAAFFADKPYTLVANKTNGAYVTLYDVNAGFTNYVDIGAVESGLTTGYASLNVYDTAIADYRGFVDVRNGVTRLNQGGTNGSGVYATPTTLDFVSTGVTIASVSGSALNMHNNKIVNVPTPTAGLDAVNKNYVDALVTGSTSGSVVSVIAGSNITTGGTATNPIVNLAASPSVNGLTISGTANVTGVLQSGGTDLNNIYVQGSGTVGSVPLWNGTKTIGNSVISQSGTGVTVNGSIQIYGNVDVLGTATTFNTQTVQTADNNITMNLSGSHVSAIYGGITVLSGTPANTSSTWTIDANGSWSSNTQIITSAITVNGGNVAVSGGGAITSGGTDLYNIFAAAGSGVQAVQPGANTTTGGTLSFPVVNVAASPSFNNVLFSGAAIGGNVQAATIESTSLSAGTLSAGTIYSAGTDLYNIFLSIDNYAYTAVQNGLNTYTGGTALAPTVNISAATLAYVSATTLSADTIYSGSTNLYNIFATPAQLNYIPLSGNGANLVTGDITIDDAVNLSWNAGNDTLQYNPVSTNVELTTSNGFDVVTGSIMSAGTDLYSIFVTTNDGAGFSGWTASSGVNSIIANNGTTNIASGNFSVAIGDGNSALTQHSSILNGRQNKTTGPYAIIAGGYQNNASTTLSFIGNGYQNNVSQVKATIVNGYQNLASGGYSFIGNGYKNSAATSHASVVGGQKNLASGSKAFIGNGYNNKNYGSSSSIVGGDYNIILANTSNIGGGYANKIGAYGSQSAIAGGYKNFVNSLQSFVGSGWANSAVTGNYASVVAGSYNIASGQSSFIGGGFSNTATTSHASVVGGKINLSSNYATFAGAGTGNTASALLASVVGGRQNTASGNISFVGGGQQNTASGYWSVVGGGLRNRATYYGSTIAGGRDNLSSGFYSFVGGGGGNSATTGYATVVGGENNLAGNYGAFVGGGRKNVASVYYSVVVGGYNNAVNAYYYSSIVGGKNNVVSRQQSFIGGGLENSVSEGYSSVVGGIRNFASGPISFLGGGYRNAAIGSRSFVGAGRQNSATTDYSVVVGGRLNKTSGNFSAIVGGYSNTASGNNSFIGGGKSHTASGSYSLIVGGKNNVVSGYYASILGGRQNNVSAYNYSTILNGILNSVGGGGTWFGLVGSGRFNNASALFSTVLNGETNQASGEHSLVLNGSGNTASGVASSVMSSSGSTISGNRSAVIGGFGIAGAADDTVYMPNARLAETTGSVIYSAGTDLYNIFGASGSGVQAVQPGSNITTGGTLTFPVINLAASPSVNGLTVSGTANVTGVLQSGGTDLNNIYVQGTGTVGTLPLWTGTKTITNSLLTQAGTGITVNGSVQIYGNVDILGTATTFNTQTVSTADNNITMNLSGSHVSALYGGITVLSGTPANTSSTWTIDANGSWSSNTQIITSAITVNGGNVAVSGGGAITSGGTDLYNIFAQPGQIVNNVNAGSNITTGGTATSPTINLVASPSVNNFTASGNTSLQGTSGTTIYASQFFQMTPYTGANPAVTNNNDMWMYSAATGVITLNYKIGGVVKTVELA